MRLLVKVVLIARTVSAVSLGVTMRKLHTGGALALLALLSSFSGSAIHGASSTQPLANHTSTLSALTAPTVPTFSDDFGAADYFPSVCTQGIYQWQPGKLPIKVCISSGAGVPGYRPTFPGMIRHAFDTWCAASGGKLSWKEVSSAAAADVNVCWTDHVTQRSNGTEAGETNAYTKLNQSTGRGIIYGARMLMLTQLPDKQFTDVEMDKTLLHETGHALGLQGHSPERTDIMYYAINADQQPALTDRDEATIQHLYADFPSANDNVAIHGQ
jgi:Matrixin